MTRVVVFGYREIGVACLEALEAGGAEVLMVVTHADDPAETVWFASMADAARRRGIPVRLPTDPNAPGCVEEIRRLKPDAVFSFYYRRLLGRALLDIPRLGAINLHGSLLPKYRGRAPINWALIQGEAVTGVTLHFMDELADHGDIVAQRAVPIAVEDTALSLSRKLATAARDLVGETYPRIVSGRAPRVPQDHAAATRYGRRRPADGLIDWRTSAWRIYNLVRAVTRPFPGAFTFHAGRRVTLWAARPPRGEVAPGPPGRLLGAGDEGSLRVATGDGVLEVLEVQVDGEREMRGAEYAAALPATDLRPGGFGDGTSRDA